MRRNQLNSSPSKIHSNGGTAIADKCTGGSIRFRAGEGPLSKESGLKRRHDCRRGNPSQLIATRSRTTEDLCCWNCHFEDCGFLLLGTLSDRLQQSFEELRALGARLQSVREEERRRIAREIHDELGQSLTAIKLAISSLVLELPEYRPSKRAESIVKLIDEAIASVRRIATELRPAILDDLGLIAAVEWAAEQFETRTGTKCRLNLSADSLTIDRERATAIFRILQEALTNVARHSGATQVDVRLAVENGGLTLEVHDNGIGVEDERVAAAQSLGVLGMQERAVLLGGKFTIRAAPDNGTIVRVRISLSD